jgi:hypothetical protein
MSAELKAYLETLCDKGKMKKIEEDDPHLQTVFHSECIVEEEGATVYFIKENGSPTHRVAVHIGPFPDADMNYDKSKEQYLIFETLQEAISERLATHMFTV